MNPDRDDVLDGLPCGVYVLDGEWRFTYINPAAADYLARVSGKPRDRLLGKSILEECPEAADSAAAGEFRRAVADRTAVEFEADHPSLGRRYAVRARPAGGGLCVYVTDVTDRRKLEADLRRRDEAVATVERGRHAFVTGLAHELRNALAPVRTALHLAASHGATDAPLGQALGLAERQLAYSSRLLKDLTRVSQLARGQVRPRFDVVDLRDVVTRALETGLDALRSRGGSLGVELPPAPLEVAADPDLLLELTLRLLDHAARSTEPGGQLRVSAEAEGREAVLRVRDDGPGLDPEDLTRAFDLVAGPGRPGDHPPAGLRAGLAVVRGLAELHGGRVEASSAGPGLGSELVVRLPLPAPSAARPPAAGGAGGALRVLVVDDNAEAAQSVALLLNLWGHQVEVAYDGPAALAEARDRRPDVVLLDIGMPGMDGYQVARRLRELHGEACPVLIALTGYGEEDDRRRATEAGFEYHMVKPVDPDDLRDVLVLARSMSRALNRPATAV